MLALACNNVYRLWFLPTGDKDRELINISIHATTLPVESEIPN